MAPALIAGSAVACALASVALGCPVPLLDVVPSTENDGQEVLRLHDTGLRYLEAQPSPLFLVPMLGVYRGGKSFLLNRLRGLSAPYAGGFGVGHEQSTHTRGASICAESVGGLGTVVWMDTEGLFSSEDAAGGHGSKIFSLAMLFSSTVVLNSLTVLSEHFFDFFGEQQQVARILRQGLADAGLPEEGLLSSNLTVAWVLQRPVRYSYSVWSSFSGGRGGQLEAFLSKPGDEGRARVRTSFRHIYYEVPSAAHDTRQWSHLHELNDDQLVPEYVASTARFREGLFAGLKEARSWAAPSFAKQLRVFAEVVSTNRFSGSMAREAFEEEELSVLCSEYGKAVAEHAGELPSQALGEAFAQARSKIQDRREGTAESFHFGTTWQGRLDRCLDRQEEDLHRRNDALIFERWQADASALAEGGDCVFVERLSDLLEQYAVAYGPAWRPGLRSQATKYARSLLRANIAHCVRLRHILKPIAPWLVWPLCWSYTKDSFYGLGKLAVHAVILVGIYGIALTLTQLPAFLDVDYPVLQAQPLLLDFIDWLPILWPWPRISGYVSTLGMAWGVASSFRAWLPAAFRRKVVQEVAPAALNIEMKLNIMLKRSEAMLKQQLVTASLEAAKCHASGDGLAGVCALIAGLAAFREPLGEDHVLAAVADQVLQGRVRAAISSCNLAAASPGFCAAWTQHGREALGGAKAGKYAALLEALVTVLEEASRATSPRRSARPPSRAPHRTSTTRCTSPPSDDGSWQEAGAPECT